MTILCLKNLFDTYIHTLCPLTYRICWVDFPSPLNAKHNWFCDQTTSHLYLSRKLEGYHLRSFSRPKPTKQPPSLGWNHSISQKKRKKIAPVKLEISSKFQQPLTSRCKLRNSPNKLGAWTSRSVP